MPAQITKVEAARRQLVTAIRLLFEDADSISIYTLAHAAWEVLDALCKHRDVVRFRAEMCRANGLSEDEIKRIASYGRNFFKHADKDPDSVLEDFSDELNDHVLVGAAFDYGEIANNKPMELQVFQLWYFAAHPEKALRPAMDDIIAVGEKLFPGIGAMSRRQKKRAGLRALMSALRDPTLMADPSTDRAHVRALD
jgi:hypothetical protein